MQELACAALANLLCTGRRPPPLPLASPASPGAHGYDGLRLGLGKDQLDASVHAAKPGDVDPRQVSSAKIKQYYYFS